MTPAEISPVRRRRIQITDRSGPHYVDLHVGKRIGLLRLHAGLSQVELAKQVGVSYQQLQKYESGRNRVSASMMHEVGVALSVPVGKFFEGLPSQDSLEDTTRSLDSRIAYIGTSEGQRLIDGVLGIAPPLRSKLLALISKMAEGETDLPAKLQGDVSFE